MKRKNWISEIVWAALIVAALLWELVGVFTEDSTGIEPLTRLVRDRLFESSELFVVGFIAFWGWLAWHWLVVKRRR